MFVLLLLVFFFCFFGCLVVWLFGCLVVWLFVWLFVCLLARLLARSFVCHLWLFTPLVKQTHFFGCPGSGGIPPGHEPTSQFRKANSPKISLRDACGEVMVQKRVPKKTY